MANPYSNPLLFNPRRRIPELVTVDTGASTKHPFKVGVVTAVGGRQVPRGGATDALNWLTRGDRIELRRGQAYLGTSSVQVGNGKSSGLKKVTDALQVEHLFGTYGKKLKYFDIPTLEWIESGSDLLGSSVVDSLGFAKENISLAEYVGVAGNQLFVNSPNCAGYFKLLVANPGSSVNQYSAAKNYIGSIKIDNSRTLLWARKADKTSLYGSYIDTQTYTTVSSESVGTGDGATVAFSKTLAGISGFKTAFGLSVTAAGTIFTDDYAGSLSAPDGSVGTINYVTGALTLTFVTAPVNTTAITVSYQTEDSTVNGIADFTKSATRSAGQGFVFLQADGGGSMQMPLGYNGTYYCMHIKKTWALTIGRDDTQATNLPYRQLVGIPNPQAACEAAEGIYFIDTTRPDEIKVKLLTYTATQQVMPVPISDNLILQNYLFDQAAAISWGDFRLFACRTVDSTANNRVLCYNKLWRAWDILDYNVNFFEIYNGTLVAGDSLTNNFMTLFSGFDDLTATINNFWISNIDLHDMPGLKATKQLYLEGDIDVNQAYDVYLSFDQGDFVKVGSVSGAGNYVDKSASVAIGGSTLGSKLIGGNVNTTDVYHYETLMNINTDAYETVRIKYIATGIGYVSVRTQKYYDVRFKGKQVPQKYRSNPAYPRNLP